ncbi:uncharacterized protein LOC113350634 [Papaver somniferum]|uniref:uncharacterized protein LOC113350634 n=1 Tax=Papaver somniferum TaxID=3469 RepID=UPI000E6FADC5|nr:uncharacterized protein LOC113350634 [Papaver somniferum]
MENKSAHIIVQSEGDAFKAGIVLDEINYDLWSQIMEMHIAEKEKSSFIMAKTKKSTEEDPRYEKWYTDNQKVKRWLLMSMSPEIMKRYIWLPTAREIWDALSKAFYNRDDEMQVFTLNRRAFSSKQNGRALSIYYGELTEIFGELDHRDKVVMENPNDFESYRKSIQRLRVHIFLAGLDESFEQIRSEILIKDRIRELESCYALVHREYVQHWWDQHLKRKKETKKNSGAQMASTKKGKDSVVTSASVARAGNDGKVLNVSSLVSNNSWIVDSGATDHMTCDSKQISSLKPNLQKTVSTANGSQAPITGEGSISLTETLNLDSVLVVPTLDLCELAKSHRASIPLSFNKSPVPFMIIHSDVWGSSITTIMGGSRWFVTFIDDCTRMTWVCLMENKSTVTALFQQFHKMINTQYNKQIQVLRSDNGGEYMDSDLQQYLERHKIIHQTTCSNTPQQNGVAERKNRHLLEVVRASLTESHMPLLYWGEALTSATYLINRVPSSTIVFQTPHQALAEAVVAPNVQNLPPHVFGCVSYVHLHKNQRDKLAPRALKCVFVGYAATKKGYRCYHPPTKRMFVTLDVVFHEDSLYFSCESELQGEYHKEIKLLTMMKIYRKLIYLLLSTLMIWSENLLMKVLQEKKHEVQYWIVI